MGAGTAPITPAVQRRLWARGFSGMSVGIDTAPLIYYVEENLTYLPTLDPFFSALAQHRFQIVTSMISLVETLVHPLRTDDAILAKQYRALLLTTDGLTTLPITPAIADYAAQLRASFAVRTPDAIQLAAAVQAGATVFLTNDARLQRVSTLTVIVLDAVLETPYGSQLEG